MSSKKASASNKPEAPAEQPPEQATESDMTAAQAAKQVKRIVLTEGKGGKVTEKKVAVSAEEVLSFRDYGDHVVVVTNDGRKLSSKDA